MKEQALGLNITVNNNAGVVDRLIQYVSVVNSASVMVEELDKESSDLNVLSDYAEAFNIVCDKCNGMLIGLDGLTFDDNNKPVVLDFLTRLRTLAIRLKSIQTNLTNRINKQLGVPEQVSPEPPVNNSSSIQDDSENLLEQLLNGLEPESLPTANNTPSIVNFDQDKDKVLNYQQPNSQATTQNAA